MNAEAIQIAVNNAESLPAAKLKDSILDIRALTALKIPERQKHFPWLPEGGLVMVYGPRGIGKTYFNLSLMVSLACKVPFLRWDAPANAAGVLLIDGEMALHDLRERLVSLLQEAPKARLETLSHEYFFSKSDEDLNFGNPEIRKALTDYLEDNPDIKVLILDNLSCLFPGLREDKRDDWVSVALPLFMWLRRRGIAVVMIHHAGKGGDQRGTSSREDSLDTVIKLERTNDSDLTQGAQFIVRFTKARGAFGDAVSDFEASLTTDQNGLQTWTWKPVEESNEERLLRLVEDGVDNVTDAAEELGLTKGAVSKLKKRLQDKKLLKPGKNLELVEG